MDASCCPPATTRGRPHSAGTASWWRAADQLDGAIARAIASGKPAVINVMTESIAAPVVKREA